MMERYAVFETQHGGRVALLVGSDESRNLIMLSREYLSIGRAIVERQRLDQADREVRHAS